MNIPTVASLGEWEVGKNALGENEVRFVLADAKEAGVWAIWFLNHMTDDEVLAVAVSAP